MSLHVEVTGDPAGPTLVFLHGLGVSSWMWAEQVQRLADRFHCVTVDLPGSGRSHAVPWRSFAETADTVATVVGATSTGRASVIGLSLGGYVAVTLLARHPDVVSDVVVSGITASPLVPVRRNRLLARAGETVMRTPALTRVYGLAMRLPREARDAMAADARVLTGATTRRIYDELVPFRLPAGLAAYADRVLAVAADHDVASIRQGLADFAAVGAAVGVARDAHHAWNAEHPELFSAMVEAWVTGRRVVPELVRSPAPQVSRPRR